MGGVVAICGDETVAGAVYDGRERVAVWRGAARSDWRVGENDRDG